MPCQCSLAGNCSKKIFYKVFFFIDANKIFQKLKILGFVSNYGDPTSERNSLFLKCYLKIVATTFFFCFDYANWARVTVMVINVDQLAGDTKFESRVYLLFKITLP